MTDIAMHKMEILEHTHVWVIVQFGVMDLTRDFVRAMVVAIFPMDKAVTKSRT